MIPDRIATSRTAKPDEELDISLSPTDRLAQKEQQPCWLKDCPCGGRNDETHFSQPGTMGPQPRLSNELRREIAELLGYPAAGTKVRQITYGELPWCRDATEEDWREVLSRAETKGPRRNPEDGSVREGWVRAVLASVMGQRADEIAPKGA